jgi:BMFP domain-containing protein YqiC
MTHFYLYADENSLKTLLDPEHKIITIGSDFGYGNFGDVLQHINALKAIKENGRFRTVSIMAANAISHNGFPAWIKSAYSTDAVVFVSEYPLILSKHDPQIGLLDRINNVSGLHLYGGGFLNPMWGDYVLSVVEFLLQRNPSISYIVSGQQITPPFERRVIDHINSYPPCLFGVRDELSRQSMQESGFDAEFSFDDATESLFDLTKRVGLHSSKGFFMHLNSSDYTANSKLRNGIGRELEVIADSTLSQHGLTLFQAFRDARQDVFDSTETIKQLDYLFPFREVRLVDLVGLLFDASGNHSSGSFAGDVGYSCSYHVALWLQLSGIPCWLRSSNAFYDQKSRALQVTQGLEEFIRGPKLADHRFNLERRAAWRERLQVELSMVPELSNTLIFADNERGSPAPWPFFYKSKPTLQDKFKDLQNTAEYQLKRAVASEHALVQASDEISELRSHHESLSEQLNIVGDEVNRERKRGELAEHNLNQTRDENVALQARIEALCEQLTTVGNEANQQRKRSELVEHNLNQTRDENVALQARIEALCEQLTTVGDEANRQRIRADRFESDLVIVRTTLADLFSSRSWRLTKPLRAWRTILGRNKKQ